MYNESQKLEYLEYAKSKYAEPTVNVIKLIFNACELTETQKGMDLCYFNRPQIIDLLKGFNSLSPDRLKSNCVHLADYYQWCLNYKHCVSDCANYYHYSLSDSIINSLFTMEEMKDKYFTEETFLGYLEKIKCVRNQFIAYAIFHGVTLEEIIRIRMKDLDNTNILTLYNKDDVKRELYIDDTFYQLMKKTDAETDYYPDGIIIENKFKTSTYIDSEFVLKPCREGVYNQPIDTQIVTKNIRVIKQQSGNKFISFNTLYLSGLMNYIKKQYEKQNIGLEIAFTESKGNRLYMYESETQKYVDEYGSNLKVKMLRWKMKDYLELLK